MRTPSPSSHMVNPVKRETITAWVIVGLLEFLFSEWWCSCVHLQALREMLDILSSVYLKRRWKSILGVVLWAFLSKCELMSQK